MVKGGLDWLRKSFISTVITHISNDFLFSDQVAVTEFAAGAMENWGLIVYKDPTLLYNPSYSTMEGKRLVADVIAHELAHQVCIIKLRAFLEVLASLNKPNPTYRITGNK